MNSKKGKVPVPIRAAGLVTTTRMGRDISTCDSDLTGVGQHRERVDLNLMSSGQPVE